MITWAFLESLGPELGGCFRMTVDVVYLGDWVSKKGGPRSNFLKRGVCVGWSGRDKYYFSNWLAVDTALLHICSAYGHMNE